MNGAVIPFEPGGSLARVEATPSGFAIDCRGPRAARRHEADCAMCAAELAVVLRDQGGWRLRFCEGTDDVQALVAEIDAEGE